MFLEETRTAPMPPFFLNELDSPLVSPLLIILEDLTLNLLYV